MADKKHRVVLQSDTPPTEEQKRRLGAFVRRTYDFDAPIEWEETPELSGGFRLHVDRDLYDWSLEGRLRQFRDKMAQLPTGPKNIIPLLRDTMEKFSPNALREELGEVASVGDGIARIKGLPNAAYGEVLEFSNGVRGMVQDLKEDSIGCVLFGNDGTVTAGGMVRCTGKTAGMPVGSKYLGRVVDALGQPVDGKGSITPDAYRPIEVAAPGILERQSVDTPMETGLLCIDSMFPIGRGQRELIIGDRQTGKTAIAIDTIINQRSGYLAGDPVYCIYVAVGQKGSTVASIVQTLREKGAMDYTIVVAATAADPAALQYYAPFAGAAIGEYFRDTGRHALVVFDDLSKQAVAYREVSLILRRPSGREAYPGDVFYLHSRLLERAAKIISQQEVAEQMNDLPESLRGKVKAGGSLTALPIIETQAGDVSAYIPTNVISITDGQIYLESSLFNAGFRPAVNVGISVSRVGGAAQVKSMKKVAGTLKIDQAQFEELESFSKFSSDLDKVTAMTLDKGRKNNQLLIQPQYTPMPVGEQVAVLYCGTRGLMADIRVDQVIEFQRLFLTRMRAEYAGVLAELGAGKVSDGAAKSIEKVAADVCLHLGK